MHSGDILRSIVYGLVICFEMSSYPVICTRTHNNPLSGFRSSIGGLVIHYESRIYPRSARVRRDAGYAGSSYPCGHQSCQSTLLSGYCSQTLSTCRHVYLEERRSIHLFSTLANYLGILDILMCPYKSAFGPAVALEQVRTHLWFLRHSLRHSLVSASNSEESRQ